MTSLPSSKMIFHYLKQVFFLEKFTDKIIYFSFLLLEITISKNNDSTFFPEILRKLFHFFEVNFNKISLYIISKSKSFSIS